MKNNLILIIIDSLRSDKLSIEKSVPFIPNMSKIIESGTFFPNCISSADATLLSWSSFFTGLHPFKTGIHSTHFKKIDPNVKTLFHILKQQKYDFYGYLPPSGKVIGLFPEFKNLDCYDEKPIFGSKLDDKIQNFLKQKFSKPWFLYIHSYNLHFPINKPQGFEDKKYGINNYEKQISLIDHSLEKILKLINFKNTKLIITSDHGSYFQTTNINDEIINYESKAKRQKIITQINSKMPKFTQPIRTKIFVRYEKLKIKNRLKEIKKLNLPSNELRGLLHYRSNSERFLYDDLIRVPLLFYGCDIPKTKISQQVRHVDFLPTILELLKIDNDLDMDGKSLVPLINGKSFDESISYFETTPLMEVTTSDMIGIRTSKLKYFRDKIGKNPKRFIFDLENDPLENINLENNSKLVKKCESLLMNIINNSDKSNFQQDDKNSRKNDDTKKIEDVLKKLGYI